MAGHVRKLENGRYIARFPLGGRGNYRSRTFDRKRDAQSWLDVQTARRDRGDWVDPSHASETFGAVADVWLATRRDVAPSTRSRDASYLRNQILPYLGDLELRHVTVERLDAWVAELDEHLAPATVRKAFGIVAQVLDRAVVLRKLSANPAKVGEGISLPTQDKTEMRFLSVAEVDDLADAIDPHYRPLVLSAAFTGLRWGELAGLKAKHLDLTRHRLTVAEVLSEVDGQLSFKKPKTPASRRTIALPSALVTELSRHLDARPIVGNALVFSDTDAKAMRRSNFRRRTWMPAVAESVGQPMRFHDLRHTHAAWLIAQGEHPKTIQTRLGHASISTTLDRYGHLMEGLDVAAAGRLDDLFPNRVKHSGSTVKSKKVAQMSSGTKKSPGST